MARGPRLGESQVDRPHSARRRTLDARPSFFARGKKGCGEGQGRGALSHLFMYRVPRRVAHVSAGVLKTTKSKRWSVRPTSTGKKNETKSPLTSYATGGRSGRRTLTRPACEAGESPPVGLDNACRRARTDSTADARVVSLSSSPFSRSSAAAALRRATGVGVSGAPADARSGAVVAAVAASFAPALSLTAPAAAAAATARAAKASPNWARAACISARTAARAGLAGSAMRARSVEAVRGEPGMGTAGAWLASRERRAEATPAAWEREGVGGVERVDEVRSASGVRKVRPGQSSAPDIGQPRVTPLSSVSHTPPTRIATRTNSRLPDRPGDSPDGPDWLA